MAIEPSHNSCQDPAATPAAKPREIVLDDGTPSLLSLLWKRNRHTDVWKVGGYLVSGYSTIEVLPVELIWDIAECLELHEAALLALSSKQMLRKFGFATFKQVPPTGFQFLQLLERDGRQLPKMLCPSCVRFHAPEESLTPSKKDCYLFAFKAGRLSWKLSSPLLPPRLHWNMVNAVMQSHRQGTGYYTVEDLKSTEEFRIHDTMVNYAARCVIANGKLLLRTVLALFPCEGGVKEQTASAPALLTILRKHDLEACCGHVSWAESYPAIFHPRPNPGMPSDADPMPITDGPCVWQSRRKKPLRGPYAADLKQCQKCRTSYTFIFKNLDGVGRVVCLVSYKDLGSGESVFDHLWGSHLWYNKPGEHPKVRRREHSVMHDWAWQTYFMLGSDVAGYGLEDWCFGSLVNGSR